MAFSIPRFLNPYFPVASMVARVGLVLASLCIALFIGISAAYSWMAFAFYVVIGAPVAYVVMTGLCWLVSGIALSEEGMAPEDIGSEPDVVTDLQYSWDPRNVNYKSSLDD